MKDLTPSINQIRDLLKELEAIQLALETERVKANEVRQVLAAELAAAQAANATLTAKVKELETRLEQQTRPMLTIISNGGGDVAEVVVPENTTHVTTVAAVATE